VTEPSREQDAPLEREAREAARGASERTPAFVFGGVFTLIAVVAGIVIAAALLLWWAL
jgi:hypothetical protein